MSLHLNFPVSHDDFVSLSFDKWTEHEHELVLWVSKFRAHDFDYPQGVSTDMEQRPSAVHEFVAETYFFYLLNVKFCQQSTNSVIPQSRTTKRRKID